MQAYAFPNMSVDIKLCRCNIAPKTIVRGPGFLNAALVAEHVLEHVAQHLDLDPVLVRERNFLTSLAPPMQQLPAILADTAAEVPENGLLSREAAQHGIAQASKAQASLGHQPLDPVLPGQSSCSRLQYRNDSDRQHMAMIEVSSPFLSRREPGEVHHSHATACRSSTLKSPMNPPQLSTSLRGPHHHAAPAQCGHAPCSNGFSAAADPSLPQAAGRQACSASAPLNRSPHNTAPSSSWPQAGGSQLLSGNGIAPMGRPALPQELHASAEGNGIHRGECAATGAGGDTRPGLGSSSCGEHEFAASADAQEMPSAAGGRLVSRPCQPAKWIAPEDDALQPGDVRTPLGT